MLDKLNHCMCVCVHMHMCALMCVCVCMCILLYHVCFCFLIWTWRECDIYFRFYFSWGLMNYCLYNTDSFWITVHSTWVIATETMKQKSNHKRSPISDWRELNEGNRWECGKPPCWRMHCLQFNAEQVLGRTHMGWKYHKNCSPEVQGRVRVRSGRHTFSYPRGGLTV